MTGIVTDLIIGILAVTIGYLTMKNNLGRYIIFVNEKKYDTDKVSKVAGTHIMAYGIISIILIIARIIMRDSEVGDALDKASIAVIFIIGALIYYNIRKNCQIDKKEEPIQGMKKKKKKKKKKRK